MTLTNEPPKEMILYGVPDLGIPDEVYTNFIPTTKESVLKRQKENINKLL